MRWQHRAHVACCHPLQQQQQQLVPAAWCHGMRVTWGRQSKMGGRKVMRNVHFKYLVKKLSFCYEKSCHQQCVLLVF